MNAGLIVTTTNGCRDTVFKTIPVIDKPPISLAFYDTIVCVNDRLQLLANGTGNFSWSPANNMIEANTPRPTVFPTTTTIYYAQLEIKGCTNLHSAIVRVVDSVQLQIMNDTTICTDEPLA